MLESNADLEIILGKVQRKMSSLLVNPQWAPNSRTGGGSEMGRGLFLGNPCNLKNDPDVAQVTRDKEIAQLNWTMFQIKNETIKLRRGNHLNLRNQPQGVSALNFLFRNKI